MKLGRALPFAILIAVSACSVTPDPQKIGPYPDDYRAIIKAHIHKTYFDPYSIRDASVSDPQQGYIYFQQGWIVCVQDNAKNRLGGYVGLTTTAYLINHGEIVDSQDGVGAAMCKNVTMIPWPELEGGGDK